MDSDDTPIIGLHDLAQLVGYDHAKRLMLGLQEREEARKVLLEQEFQKAGRLDRAVDHFYDEECDGRMEAIIPGGAYVYWWLRSKQMGGEVGDFWRDEESTRDFYKRNPGVIVKNRMRRARSGFTGASEGVVLEAGKYAPVTKKEVAA